jgi:diadenosine tetraphosphate (Ap4A) HIT family hydrolase
MASIFTKIIEGDLPGQFVWKDDAAVAFLSIAPLKPGHTLVVPRAEVDHWIDLDLAALQHLTSVAHAVGNAIQNAFDPVKVGTTVLGLEVPHVHIHLVPIWTPFDLNFENADANAKPEDIAMAADQIRAELRAMGRSEVTSS